MGSETGKRCIQYFNPRSPCGERHGYKDILLLVCQFQSTLPVRGATCRQASRRACSAISIHAPRAGSDSFTFKIIRIISISIHAPRAGSDEFPRDFIKRIPRFQSTLPVRGATHLLDRSLFGNMISIHAPRAGSDENIRTWLRAPDNFNPRSPCGERRFRKLRKRVINLFQSTLPVRGATLYAGFPLG